MENRLKLHQILIGLLGSKNVYFQPPEGYKISYDCIVYECTHITPTFADNCPYLLFPSYRITAICKHPDSDLPEKIARLPMCSHERHFTSGNLHHNVFHLYFGGIDI